MCGIAGFVGHDPDRMAAMLAEMVHRGPDGGGATSDPRFSIGMRRLAIVDVEDGEQPMLSADGALRLVFNGEIYNAVALRRELEAAGRAFATDHSDTEVILVGYQHWGADVVTHLIGMFAFAIADATTGELLLARDRLGIKPLYWARTPDGGLSFASELKVLFRDERVPRRPEADVVRRFLVHRIHDDGAATFFDGVERLLPGHTMTVRADGTTSTRRYWDPEVNTEFHGARSDDDYAEEFRAAFDKVVARHLIADVPVGVPLSGGLDSSGVATTMAALQRQGADLHTQGLHTFSAVFPGETIDETDYIHSIEAVVGSTPHYVTPTLEGFWDEIMEWVRVQEEPTIASAPYAYYSVYRLAHEHVKVMVSGNGGDELLAGYLPYGRTYLTSAVDSRHYGAAVRELVQGWDLYRKYVREAAEGRFARGPKPLSAHDFLLPGGVDLGPRREVPRNLNERLASDVLQYSTPNLLRYEDKNSMAFSIESRVPFLDHELVEFVFSLPVDQKIDGGWNRAVYRRAMKGRIPDKNRLRRSKIGFTNPDMDWLRAKTPEVREILGSPEVASRGLYDQAALLRCFDEWLAGRPGDGLIFWRVLVTELWMRVYVDEKVAA